MTGGEARGLAVVALAAAVGTVGELAYPGIYLASGLVLSGVVVWWSMGEQRLDGCEWLALAVVAWGVLGAVLVSGDAYASKTTLGSWAAGWAIWVFSRRAGVRGGRGARAFLVGASFILVVALVLEFIGLRDPRVAGLMSNPNITVALVSSAVPMVLILWRRSWVAVVAAVVLAVPLIFTGSRAAALALVVLVGVLVPPSRAKKLVVIVCAVVLGLAVGWRMFVNPESLAWHRLQIWQAVLEMSAESPMWGIGAADLGEASGAFRIEHSGEVARWGHVIGTAESMLFGVVVRIGFPGGILMLAWLVAILRRVDLRRESVASLGAIAVVGAFHDFLSEPAVLWWWAAVLGLSVPHRGIEPPAKKMPDTPIRFLRSWLVTLAVAGLCAWTWIQPSLATSLMWSGRNDEKVDVAKIVQVEPWHPDPMRHRIRTLLAQPSWTWAQGSEALDWSRRLTTVCPGAAWAWELRAMVLTHVVRDFGAWPATVEAVRDGYRRASDLQPRVVSYTYRWALFERSFGDLSRARRLVNQAVNEEPEFARGWLLVARIALDEGRTQQARRAFQRVEAIAAIDPRRVRTSYQRSIVEVPSWQLANLRVELE